MNGHMRYDVGGDLTAIAPDLVPRLSGLPSTPVDLCASAQALVVLPDLAVGFGIPEERHDEKSIRAASDIIRVLCSLDDRPIEQDRSLSDRIVGTCRHFLCRQGGADPSRFGVAGFPHAWGIAEVRGNAVRDLAALNKVEMLPWDEWGRMEKSYKDRTGPEYDELMDTIAATCASNDEAAIENLYATEDLAVPATMVV